MGKQTKSHDDGQKSGPKNRLSDLIAEEVADHDHSAAAEPLEAFSTDAGAADA